MTEFCEECDCECDELLYNQQAGKYLCLDCYEKARESEDHNER